MKTLVVAFCFLAGSAALAQSAAGVLPSEPVITQFNSHEAHATQEGMGDPQTVLESSSPMIAQGERPLWEVAPMKAAPMPLGDVARMFKKEKLEGKKPTMIWEN